jgi:hypothetical protein
MATSRQHVIKGLLLGLIVVALILTMAGYGDTLIQGAGMGLVTDKNRDYLEDAFDRSLVGFLVLSGIKSGLAIIEGSEVGIGFNLEIGDIVQSVYDYVDVAWLTALAGGAILLMTRFCLDAVALVDHWVLVLMLLSIGVYWVLTWYLPHLRRISRVARESMIFLGVVSLTLYIILPIAVAGASFLSRSITQPLIEATQDEFQEINQAFSPQRMHNSLFPPETESESIFSSLDFTARFEKTKERIQAIGEYFKDKTRHIAILTLKLVAAYLFDCIIFPLTFFVILYLFTRNFIRFINRSVEPIPLGE